MSAGWTLFNPNGTSIYYQNPGYGANALVDTMRLAVDGTYEIVLDPTDTQTGSVTFKVWSVPEDLSSPMIIGGGPVPVIITSPGQNANVAFQGTAGDRVQLAVSGATMGGGWVLWQPDGSALTWQIAGYGLNAVTTVTLPQTGTYRLTIDPTDVQTGSVSVGVSASP
jgi:hypothetical protein